MITIYLTHAPHTESRSFLERVLSEFYQISHPKVKENEHGKPYLCNSTLHFNLAHGQNLLALAVGDTPVGLDLEVRSPRKTEKIAQRLTPAEKNTDFFKVWTAKEAYVKYLGETLASRYAALEYDGERLLERGAPVPAHLRFIPYENAILCLCTEKQVQIKLTVL